MTDETALKTAEYIESHADGEVTLVWFGGEPLVNTKVIDTITQYLIDHDVLFKSHIVTNSYLFTPELIEKANNTWKLVQAQVTLDGTRDNYNRIKNYSNSDKDAYSRVIRNIKRLAENGIKVVLYLTLSRENENDIYILLQELKPMLAEYHDRILASPYLLQQYGGSSDEDLMQHKLILLKRWMHNNGLMKETMLPESLTINSCTADNSSMVIIQADGGLNRCDHIGESEPFGSVYSDELNKDIYAWWTEREAPIPECNNCMIYPQCLKLKHCASKKFRCTETIRTNWILDVEKSMEILYNSTVQV